MPINLKNKKEKDKKALLTLNKKKTIIGVFTSKKFVNPLIKISSTSEAEKYHRYLK
jgi:hypothetical protein